MDQQVVSAHEYLRQQGQSFIVLHPTEHLLYLGFGCEDIPRVVPHCIAENTAARGAAEDAAAQSSSKCTWAPDEQAYETLAEVGRCTLQRCMMQHGDQDTRLCEAAMMHVASYA
jgi:predicted acetyltransferase